MESENQLNEKILKITMAIKDLHPELSKYLGELSETIPNDNKPEITSINLMGYYETLKSILDKYSIQQKRMK